MKGVIEVSFSLVIEIIFLALVFSCIYLIIEWQRGSSELNILSKIAENIALLLDASEWSQDFELSFETGINGTLTINNRSIELFSNGIKVKKRTLSSLEKTLEFEGDIKIKKINGVVSIDD